MKNIAKKQASNSLVEVTKLSRRFGKQVALNQVDYQVNRGQIYGLVGTNGAGKTTLIKHLLGLLRAKSGDVKVFGFDPVKHPVEVLGRIGYLSEERDMPGWMTINELMRYSQAFHKSWDSQYANELLDNFKLDQSKKILELSKGMRAQTGLVAAVAHRPELLILDEPSSGLDAAVREDILQAIVRTITDDGRTVVFSSHLLDEVERMSDHVTMINQGRIILDAPLESLKESYHRSSLVFPQALQFAPAINGVLLLEGGDRSWSAVHKNSTAELQQGLSLLGGEISHTRPAALHEIFLGSIKQNAGIDNLKVA